MVDVEREDPDSPDPVEIKHEAMLILLGAIAAKEGPEEGGGDAGGPETAADVTPQVAMGAPRTSVGPRRLPVGLISRPGRTVKRPVARRPALEGRTPVRKGNLQLRA